MPLEFVIVLTISFFILYLGFIILFQIPKNITNIFFFLICIFTVFWSIANYFSVVTSTENALFWIRLVLFFAVFHIFSYYVFINNYPSEKLAINKLRFLTLSASAFSFAALTLSDKIFEKVISKNGILIPLPGKFMPLFSFFIFSMLILGVFSAWKKHQILREQSKKEWIFISLSLFIGYFLVIMTQFVSVNFFQNTIFVPYAPLFMLPVILGMGYAIIKYQALNIRIIGSEIFILLMLSLFLVNLIQSKTTSDLVINLIIFIILFFIGLMLIKSILIEVEQREKLEQLNRIKSEFLSFASHQVKAPMAVVKGYAELIIEGIDNVPEQAKDFAKKIKHSVDNLLLLIEEFMDYRKIEENKLEFDFEDVELINLTKNIINNLQLAAKEKNLQLTLETSFDQLIVKADKLRLSQVIQNLIDNAIKYTPQGWVKVYISRENNQALITVSDSGIGVSKELQTKLFGEFIRDANIKKEIRGTGLGLYIAKNIVEAHQGKIWVESEGEGKGSKFFVAIPLIN